MKRTYFFVLVFLGVSGFAYSQNNEYPIDLYQQMIDMLKQMSALIDQLPQEEKPKPPEPPTKQALTPQQLAALSTADKEKSDAALANALKQLQKADTIEAMKDSFIQTLSADKDFKYSTQQSIHDLADQLFSYIEQSIVPEPTVKPAQYLEQTDPNAIIKNIIDRVRPFVLADKKTFADNIEIPLTLTIFPLVFQTGTELFKRFEEEMQMPGFEPGIPAPPPAPGAPPPAPPPPMPRKSEPLKSEEIAKLSVDEREASNKALSNMVTSLAKLPVFKENQIKTPEKFIADIAEKVADLKKQLAFKYEEKVSPAKLAQSMKDMLTTLIPKPGQDIKMYLMDKLNNFENTITQIKDIISPAVLGDAQEKETFFDKVQPLLKRILLKMLILVRSEFLKIPEPYSAAQMEQSDNAFLKALEVTNKKTAAEVSMRIAQNLELLVINPNYLKYTTIIDERFKKERVVIEKPKVKREKKSEFRMTEEQLAQFFAKKKKETPTEPAEKKPATPAPSRPGLIQEDSLFDVLAKSPGTYILNDITPEFISNYVFSVDTLLPQIKKMLRFPLTGARTIKKAEYTPLSTLLMSLQRPIDVLFFLQALVDKKVSPRVKLTWHVYNTPTAPTGKEALKKLSADKQQEIQPFTNVSELKNLSLQKVLQQWLARGKQDLIAAQKIYLLEDEEKTSNVSLTKDQVDKLNDIVINKKGYALTLFETIDTQISSIRDPRIVLDRWIEVLRTKNIVDENVINSLKKQVLDEHQIRVYYIAENILLYEKKVSE